VLHNCTELLNADATTGTLSDPYCLLRLGDEVFLSRKINNDLNPVFEEQYHVAAFDWEGSSSSRCIDFHVKDHDVTHSDDPIGAASIDLVPYRARLEAGEVVKIEAYPLVLTDGGGAQQGTVTLSVSMPEATSAAFAATHMTPAAAAAAAAQHAAHATPPGCWTKETHIPADGVLLLRLVTAAAVPEQTRAVRECLNAVCLARNPRGSARASMTAATRIMATEELSLLLVAEADGA
jgi:hypothetical protein